jgi:hypothetical protein
MKRIARRAAVAFAALVVTAGIVGMPATAEASKDTGWGCGGACRVIR